MQKHRILEQKCPPELKLISYCAIANGSRRHTKKRLGTFGAGGFWKSQISPVLELPQTKGSQSSSAFANCFPKAKKLQDSNVAKRHAFKDAAFLV